MKSATEMYKATVPKLAKIVQLLGGWDPLLDEDGEPAGIRYAINLDRGLVRTWNYEGRFAIIERDPTDPDKFKEVPVTLDPDDPAEFLSEDRDPDHKFKALCITLDRVEGDYYHVEVGLWGLYEYKAGDVRAHNVDLHVYYDRNWEFRVPRGEGWQAGEWYVHGTAVMTPPPSLEHWPETADRVDEKARELAREAAEFDRYNLIVDGCLRLVEEKMGTSNK